MPRPKQAPPVFHIYRALGALEPDKLVQRQGNVRLRLLHRPSHKKDEAGVTLTSSEMTDSLFDCLSAYALAFSARMRSSSHFFK